MSLERKILVSIILLTLVFPLLAAQERSPRWGLSLYGSVNMFLRSGSAADYEIGVNEFPLTDSHTSYGFGLALHSKPLHPFYWGVTLEYLLDTKTTIKDPVDDDKAEVDSHGVFAGFISAGYRVVQLSSLALSLQAGLGGYYLFDNQGAQYTTRKGYILEIEPVDKNSGFAAFAGLGIEIRASRSLAIIFHSRYLYLAAPMAHGAALMQLGVTLAF